MSGGEHPDGAATEAERTGPEALAATLPSTDLEDTVAAPEGGLPAAGPALLRGAQIGHFTVLEPLGSGGMGVVVTAYDPNLDRKVALKLLRGELWAGALLTDGRQRLLREAQAMARLQHPNVVTVYEVGTVDGQVFVAMEYVAGQTLGGWLGERKRPWREVLAAFVDAGRGLAAAHRAGIVHRDFKPDNVLVGRDGQIRVGDFGLASAEPGRRRSGVVATPDPDPERSPSMTRAGTLVGTPAYMSPEQHRGEHADARSDQFSFCVALWEGLHGERPYQGDGYRAYADAVLAGRVREPPAGTSAPAWLRRVLRRGLETDPARRFPSMDELLAELGRDPAVARRRWTAGAVVAGLAGLAAWGLLRGGAAPPAETRCRGAEATLAGVWDEPVRAAVARGFAASGRIYAADTFARVARLLDERTGAMTAMRRDACEATHIRGEQSAELLDRRIGCLDDRLAETRALTRLFADPPEGAVVDRAVEATMTLPAVGRCADVDALLAAVPPPDDPAARAAVARVRQQLAEAEALGKAGRYQAMLELAESAVRAVAGLGYQPVVAEAGARRAEALQRMGKHKEGERAWLQVTGDAARARDDALLARAWIQLLYLAGYAQNRFDDAAVLEPVAAAAVTRAGDDPLIRGWLDNAIGAVRMSQGRYEESRERFARVLRSWETVYGAEHVHTATALTNLAQAEQSAGHYADALVSARRALAIRDKLLGPDHPMVATAVSTRGAVLSELGRDQEAVADFRRALAIRERALGAEHPTVATSLHNLAMELRPLGHDDEALALLQRALAIRRKVHGDQDDSVAASLMAIANLLHHARRETEALAHANEAVAIRTRALGPDHPELADILSARANILRELRRFDEAREQLLRALTIREKSMGADHPYVASALQNLGLLALARGRGDEAAAHYSRAVAINEKAYPGGHPNTLTLMLYLARARERQGRRADADALLDRVAAALPETVTGSVEVSKVAWDLADGLWKRNRPGDRARARGLAGRARAEMVAAHAAPRAIAPIDAWLEEHPLAPAGK